VRTTACSKILGDFKPPYESTVTTQLWRDGAVMLGKLNNDEFAMGSSNETSCFGPVVNPWRREGSDAKLVPGGSSGGSASAVAAGLCLGATGTDTGGSIRQPAALTAVTGLKPTYGLCSRYGLIAFASSLDTPGPFARTAEDCALLLNAMAGHDARDATSIERPAEDYRRGLVATASKRPLDGLRIGLPREYFASGIERAVVAAVEAALDELLEHPRAACRAQVGGHQHVLVRDRNAGQRTAVAARERVVGGPRLRERTFLIDGDERVDRRRGGDPRERFLHEFDARRLARAERA
jgi:aspartyl-tRNA(Asn)/glutamyl-tRNA(Gln) amidotransferase subunit A